jgi:cbb3-type cytochrome oxidase maturation protein
MSVLVILILASLGLALLFLAAFIWSVQTGQFEDTTTPSLRILGGDPDSSPPAVKSLRTKSSPYPEKTNPTQTD